MAPPKRALFSLNYNSDVEHFDQHVSRKSDQGEDSIKLFDEREVSHVVRPFKKTVNKAVNEVIKDTGKKVHSVDGDLHYTSQTSKSGTNSKSSDYTNTTHTNSNLSIHSASTRHRIESKYDVSDL
ncbi:hypothetical protein EK21DRAFT_115903 [Setomelanomma holmii]|uniref:Uncharacterized protein n=1 Tax=Setomelanomma holmii TaxID=210430 RepID=A0A9P4LJS6_9PLEO|nr:hypothetical protein EK21DRAFT_115903 [Setomelanomma holmii]